MASRSTPPSETIRVEADVVFARRDTGDLLLDLYRPVTVGTVPVVLWLHGGGWFAGDRTLAPDLARHAVATGCAMASIEYRLSSQALFPAQLHDVRAAVRFLTAHAGPYGLRPGAVGLWGASAGGHLAALAGLTGHLAEVPGERESGAVPVKAVAVSYPPVDLAEVVADAETARPGLDAKSTPEARLLGGHPARLPEQARLASPLTWISPGAPPFQISHGTADVLVSHRQSERLHAALVAASVPSELHLLDGYRHGFLNPPGRLDVALGRVMDDGRLAAEGEQAAFGFSDIHDFFRKHLMTEENR
ncbi:alpha/beta hydrolase [Amycolatopsis roodepoortensis]|uniref:alpha/beta hydrolase n=1 Tax=Amycolatopsis roodepoortensis TaxID=700274 RepID=UPI00214CA8BE|nr:alpha/beta hydrolase [Amycolatopsis roodepoortensis]UUV31508.1 alpha/beta hydrolase [Amycolatopsis roodepoortensis]